jgi:hypothetical protein
MTDCDSALSDVSVAYKGHDNTVTIVPYSDVAERTFYDMSAVTKVEVSADVLGSTVVGDALPASSDDVLVTVWWEQIGTTDEWRIYIKVGMIVGIAAGQYNLRVVITEPAYPNGLVLTDDLAVLVVDEP